MEYILSHVTEWGFVGGEELDHGDVTVHRGKRINQGGRVPKSKPTVLLSWLVKAVAMSKALSE